MAKQFVCNKTEPVVQTKAGKLRGFLLDGTYTFHGIKYADAKRFQMPEEVKPWEGIKDALSYGYVCPMINDPVPNGEVMVPHRYWPVNEDCQYLNIWSQSLDPDAKKPVMVWLHGGGFSDGSSIEQVCYDGENMSKYGDVVVVSLNHRLNVLGYLDVSSLSPDFANSANAGTEDMVAALRWIRDNIRNFGGDPDNVTLFGQSGGGGKIWTLMQTPSAEGLFHKGIIQSGVFDMIPVRQGADGKAITQAILDELGIHENQAEALAAIPYRQLADAYKKVAPELEKQGEYVGLAPLANDFLPGDPRQVGFTPFARTVPVIVGTVLGEFSFGPAIANREALSEEEINAMIEKKYGDSAPELIRLFKAAYPEKHLTDLLFVDHLFRAPSRDFIVKKAAHTEAPTYSYQFTLELTYDGGHVAWHCSEIPFVFHNTEKIPYCNIPGVSDKLEEQMFNAWVQFARTGNPNHPGLPQWPACTPDDEAVMIFDKTCEVKHNFDAELVDLIAKTAPDFRFDDEDQPIQH